MSQSLTTGHCAQHLCERYAALLGSTPTDYADVFDCAYIRSEIRAGRLVAARHYGPDRPTKYGHARKREDFRVLLPDLEAYLRTHHTRVAVSPVQPAQLVPARAVAGLW